MNLSSIKSIKRTLCIAVILLCTTTLFSCGTQKKDDGGKISVVTTNFAMYDFARAVCGDVCEVEMLISPGSEAHDFEAGLSDIAKIVESDIFLYVGGESEEWVEDIFAAVGDDMRGTVKLCAMDICPLLTEEMVEGMESDDMNEHADEGELARLNDDERDRSHGDGAFDEHVWTSVPNAVRIMEKVRDTVISLDGTLSDRVNENFDKYAEMLSEIDREGRECVKNASRDTIVVTDRFPFRYMANEWGFKYYAAFSGCSSNVEPSLETVSFLINKVEDENIPYVFIIEFSDGKTAKAVSAETGCGILELHSAHNVTKEDFSSGVTYADLMRRNLDALKDALN